MLLPLLAFTLYTAAPPGPLFGLLDFLSSPFHSLVHRWEAQAVHCADVQPVPTPRFHLDWSFLLGSSIVLLLLWLCWQNL